MNEPVDIETQCAHIIYFCEADEIDGDPNDHGYWDREPKHFPDRKTALAYIAENDIKNAVCIPRVLAQKIANDAFEHLTAWAALEAFKEMDPIVEYMGTDRWTGDEYPTPSSELRSLVKEVREMAKNGETGEDDEEDDEN